MLQIASESHASTWVMVGSFAALLTLFQIGQAFYSIFAGPYSSFPGPKLAKATRLPYLLHRLRGDAEQWTVQMHAKYGDIVQLAPGQLTFASGHAWKDIYGHSVGGKTRQFPKDPMFYSNRPPGVYDIIWSNDVDHTRMRRNLAHAFSDRALREQEPLLRKYVDELVVKLGEQRDTTLDIVRWYNYCTFDIMSALTFTQPLGCLSQGEYTPWVQLVYKAIKASVFIAEKKHFPFLRPFLSLAARPLIKQRAIHWANSAEQVDKRLAMKETRPDIWGKVMSAKEEQRLSLAEMHVNSQVLMLAGTETTATLLSGLTYLLLRNPEKMEAVKKEIRDNFSSAEEIDIDAVLRLKYVNACFEEALRMYPPIPAGLPRVIPKGGDLVCGQPIPEGTSVAVHQLSTYRNPNNFRRPYEFIPERWLGEAEFEHDQRDALQPFSVGPRNCIGKNLAYLEMRLIFANVLWHYDITLCEESQNWIADSKTFTLWEKPALNVRVYPALREKQGPSS